MHLQIVSIVNMTRLRAARHYATSLLVRVRKRVPLPLEYVLILVFVLSMLYCGRSVYNTTMERKRSKHEGYLPRTAGSRRIILGAWIRERPSESSGRKHAVVHFLGEGRDLHFICITHIDGGEYITSFANVRSIHEGQSTDQKCTWGGHLAECEVDEKTTGKMMISLSGTYFDSKMIEIEQPLKMDRQPLVVCVAPIYSHTQWEILLTAIESWLVQGATKIVVPVQSASKEAWTILKQYESSGHVLIRAWSQWPMLHDVNPNGLVANGGIEEAHVNSLFFVKPWAEMVVFTHIDHVLLPVAGTPPGHPHYFQSLFESDTASIVFEHRELHLTLESRRDTLASFSFDFLAGARVADECKAQPMRASLVVNASRVDTVGALISGVHPSGHTQKRVACEKAHFHRMRHSRRAVGQSVDTRAITTLLNNNWPRRLRDVFHSTQQQPLNASSTHHNEDFERCMSAVCEGLHERPSSTWVPRCVTPHACYDRVKSGGGCVAARGDYEFFRTVDSYFIVSHNTTIQETSHCPTHPPSFANGNHFLIP